MITNRDANPPVPNSLYGAGRPFSKRAVVVAVTGDTNVSQYGFFTLSSSAHMESVKLSNDALSASTAINVGLYETTQFPGSGGVFGAVIAGGLAGPYNTSALTNTNTCFGSTTAMTSAATKAEIMYSGSGQAYTFTTADNPLWKMLGFTADPLREFDLVVTVTTTVVAGGAILLEATYKMQ